MDEDQKLPIPALYDGKEEFYCYESDTALEEAAMNPHNYSHSPYPSGMPRNIFSEEDICRFLKDYESKQGPFESKLVVDEELYPVRENPYLYEGNQELAFEWDDTNMVFAYEE
jgi:hypothetical protein